MRFLGYGTNNLFYQYVLNPFGFADWAVETGLYDFVYPNQITDLFIRSGYLLFVHIIWTDLFYLNNMAI